MTNKKSTVKNEKIKWVQGTEGQKHAYYGWSKTMLCYTIKKVKNEDISVKRVKTDSVYIGEGTMILDEVCEMNGVHLGAYNFTRYVHYKQGTPAEKTQLDKLMKACQKDLDMKLKMIKDNSENKKADIEK